MGLKLGTSRLMSYINKFGFGEETEIDLNGESHGILFKEEKMGQVETATTAFGQGISVTPIQQVTAVSAAINGGILYKPYIVKSIIDSSSNSPVYSRKPQKRARVISKETSELVKYTLETVVASGTGRNAYLENYRVGGKTGTAQKVENGRYSDSSYILSFIGFMPADDPKVVVYVAIDTPHNVTQYGGTVAAPIAKNIFLTAVKVLDIAPSKESMPKEYTWLDQKYVILPDVQGMNIKEAKKTLQGFQLSYSGEGEKVVYQSPQAGTYVKEGGVVQLMLS